MEGIVIVAHGSRVPESKNVYEEIAKKVRNKINAEVEIGYMTHLKPTPVEAINSLVERGFKKIVVIPLFISPGIHVIEDIPNLIGISDEEKLKLPGDVEIYYERNIGDDDRLVEILVDRAKEGLNALKR
ncbi:MAG: CbiX/SirB N-terminal domain-containing protein [Candidatus Hydrothermarchaeota archaeon]